MPSNFISFLQTKIEDRERDDEPLTLGRDRDEDEPATLEPSTATSSPRLSDILDSFDPTISSSSIFKTRQHTILGSTTSVKAAVRRKTTYSNVSSPIFLLINSQILEQMPQVVTSLDPHVENGLQSVPHLKTVAQLLTSMESNHLSSLSQVGVSRENHNVGSDLRYLPLNLEMLASS
ncbi:hypothetical protein CDL15_Pgr020991 [Punica granatum]|nr:hypothetical protein CDL15_Pgr020991 [Punica granatum]